MFKRVYSILLSRFGPQGWWPVPSVNLHTGAFNPGYHVGNYDIPIQQKDKFFVIIGTVLTQNTAWKNVESAVRNLLNIRLDTPEKILNCSISTLEDMIRSSGCFRQKAVKLKVISEFIINGKYLTENRSPVREDLLNTWGIGGETADSILLYAFHRSIFIIDAYTRRIAERVGLISGGGDYETLQKIFETELKGTEELYNEYHALLVKLAKDYCRKTPMCEGCPLESFCEYKKKTDRV